jgi:HTH-type transcriptional regulator / antitoxin HigA
LEAEFAARAGGKNEVSTVAFNEAIYRRLVSKALPHVIHTDEENERCIAKLEALSNRRDLSSEEKELADLLTVLIEKYEERYQIQPASTPAERVRHFMDAQDLKAADMLDIFGTKSIVSEVLSGKRELSKAHIRALSKRFHVSPEIFFQCV